jgi:hypothetical protein
MHNPMIKMFRYVHIYYADWNCDKFYRITVILFYFTCFWCVLLYIFKWIVLFNARNDLSSSLDYECTVLQSTWVLATSCRRGRLQKLFTYLYSRGFRYRDLVAVILRPRKEVPWMVGVTPFEASHFPPIPVFPSNRRWPMSVVQSVWCYQTKLTKLN